MMISMDQQQQHTNSSATIPVGKSCRELNTLPKDECYITNYGIEWLSAHRKSARKIDIFLFPYGAFYAGPSQVEISNCTSQCKMNICNKKVAAKWTKSSLGQEYEVKLIKHANAADLTFHLEARLRERGFDKTPDLLLIYPIAIGCNVVNWIESKALFADREVHSMYFVHQYERYCSRYGPGLVIYWFGFVESLREDDPSILVRDNFPKYIKHMNLLVDDASDVEADEENGALPEWEVAEPSSEEMTKFLERFSN